MDSYVSDVTSIDIEDNLVRSNDFEAFCHRVGQIINLAPEIEVPSRIAAELKPLLAAPDFLTSEQRAVPAIGYQRHTVFVCPRETFSVLAVVWPAGIVSPIHDHMTWCAFGVYEGTVREIRYAPTGAESARVATTQDLSAGEVACLPVDAPDIHCMENPTSLPAVSIHVYAGNADTLGPNVKRIYTCES